MKTLIYNAIFAPDSDVARANVCKGIRFQRGHYAATVRGVAPPDDTVCNNLGAGGCQTERFEVSGRDPILAIDGIVDTQDAHSLTIENGPACGSAS